MRIIGGKYKGKRFNPPSNFKARPTTDFAKEALFNILANNYNFENIDVLDLFSGTGSISYEFCSHGCKSLIAVEKTKTSAYYIKRKLEELGFSQAKIIHADVFKYLRNCTFKFDVVFADPPFDFSETEFMEIYNLVFENNILSDTSFLIIEHSANIDFSTLKHFVEKKTYGKVNFSFFDPLQ